MFRAPYQLPLKGALYYTTGLLSDHICENTCVNGRKLTESLLLNVHWNIDDVSALVLTWPRFGFSLILCVQTEPLGNVVVICL